MADNSEDKRIRPLVPPDTPAIFIDGYQGVALSNGVVRLNLTRDIYPTGEGKESTTTVVGQLIMGALTASSAWRVLIGLPHIIYVWMMLKD